MEIKVSAEEFKKLYLDTSRTVIELAEYLQVSENQVIRAAKRLGISRRKPSNKLIIVENENET